MKKILFISPGPPNSLNRIRSLNILKALKDKAEIHFICLNTKKEDYHFLEKNKHLYKESTVFHQPKLFSYFWCFLGLFKLNSLRLSYCNNKGLRKYLATLDSETYDIVIIATLRMAQYARYFPPEKVWIDLTDSMSLYYSRLSNIKVSLGSKLIALYEGKIFREFEKNVLKAYKTIYCSKIDQAYAQSLLSDDTQASTVIPNVVDLEDFPFFEKTEKKPFFHLCYWGMLDATFNYTAVEILIHKIFSSLQEKSSDYRLGIIGPGASEKLLKNQSESIQFHGYVPNLVKKLNEFDLFVCPLILGTGVKNKILQSLACGLPVLTTSIGAEGIEGIDKLKKERIIIIEDDISLYPDIIEELRQSSRKIDSQRMRKFIEEHYSIKALQTVLANKNFM